MMTHNQWRAPRPILIATAIILIAYILPWITVGSTSLTFGAFDLAEWVSLHPQVRFVEPALVTPLLLRLPPVILTITVGFVVGSQKWTRLWWFVAVGSGLIVIAMLPPLEFFSISRGDPNYQQLFALSVVTLIGSIVSLSGVAGRHAALLAIVLAFVGIAVSVAGVVQTFQVMSQLALPVAYGVGSIITSIGFSLMIAILVLNNTKSRSKS